jgi:hypothetical protein
LLKAGDGGKVERVEALGRREPGGADPPFHGAAFAINQLQLDQPQQVAGMIDTLAGAFTGDLLILAQHRWQLQLLEMMGQQNLRGARRGAGRQRVLASPDHAASSGTNAESSAARVVLTSIFGRCGYAARSSRPGRRSIRARAICLTASNPMAPTWIAWLTAKATISIGNASSSRKTWINVSGKSSPHFRR